MATEIINAIVGNALDIVIAVISILVSFYVIPAIKNQLVPWLKEKHLYDVVYKAVLAAEKLGETGQIPKVDKKKYVIGLLAKKGIATTPEIEQFIESACQEIDIIEQTAIDAIKDGD